MEIKYINDVLVRIWVLFVILSAQLQNWFSQGLTTPSHVVYDVHSRTFSLLSVSDLASHFTENIESFQHRYLNFSLYLFTSTHSSLLLQWKKRSSSDLRPNPPCGLTSHSITPPSGLCSTNQPLSLLYLPVLPSSQSDNVWVSCILENDITLACCLIKLSVIFLSFSLPHTFLKEQLKFPTSMCIWWEEQKQVPSDHN